MKQTGEGKFEALIDELRSDRRFAAIVKNYEAAEKGAKKFGSKALKVNGKIFAMVVNDRLVVKLPKVRVDELVEAKRGEYFDPGHGRLMKQWISITSSRVAWIDLAREAPEFVTTQ